MDQKYFQTNQLLRSLLRYVWVKVKVQFSIGLPLLNGRIMFEVGGVPLSVAKRRYVLRSKSFQLN
jgi:hypothetical protein